MQDKPLFITGIGTGIGKTIVSAILVEHLKADYWKPIQAGDLDDSDTIKVKNLVSNSTSKFYPEAYRLTQPFSPHKAADLDGIVIDPKTIVMPHTANSLVIEGAGGLMVPLNNDFLMIDLLQQLSATAILVVKHYLGSINHTLLSLEALQTRNIPIKAVIFNGDKDDYSESLIRGFAKTIPVISIPEIGNLTKENIASQKIQL